MNLYKNITKYIKHNKRKFLVIFISFSLCLSNNIHFLTLVYAQESTPSATPQTTSAPSPATTISPTPYPIVDWTDLPASPSAEVNITPTTSIAPLYSYDPTEIPFTQSPTPSPLPSPTLMPTLALPSIPVSSATIKLPLKIRSTTTDFAVNQQILFTVENTYNEDLTAQVLNNFGNLAEIKIVKTSVDENITNFTLIPHVDFHSGKYTFSVKSGKDRSIQTDFTWGMLLINPNQSVYQLGEKAQIYITAFNPKGEFICKAPLSLSITDPKGKTDIYTTQDGSIEINPDCDKAIDPLKSAYSLGFVTKNVGSYKLDLTATIDNKPYHITDKIEVDQTLPFYIKRQTTNQMYSPYEYPMKLEVIAKENFSGQIIETVPQSFAITPHKGGLEYDQVKIISGLSTNSFVSPPSFVSLGYPFKGIYRMSQGFGEDLTDPLLIKLYNKFGVIGHDGLDFALPIGTPVFATADGQVLLAENGIYGRTVILQHAWGRTYYGHLSKFNVAKGDQVKKGDLLALSGNTGLSTGPHLHFGIKLNSFDLQNGYYGKIDPLPYLNSFAAFSDYTVKTIIWNVSLRKGENLTLAYNIKPSLGGPKFYAVGPLQFRHKSDDPTKFGDLVFQDKLPWYFATDVTSVIEYAIDQQGQITVQKKQKKDFAKDKIYVSHHQPATSPEKFYLNLSQIAESEALSQNLNLLNLDHQRQINSVREKYKNRLLKVKNQETGQEREFLPYYVTQLKDGAYHLFNRTEDGIQRYSINPSSLTIELAEKKEQQASFSAISKTTPVFQYQKDDGLWTDYSYASSSAITLGIKKETANFIVFTQNFSLSTGSSPAKIEAEAEFMFGFLNDKFTSKLTYRLKDNHFVNRLLWQNTLVDPHLIKEFDKDKQAALNQQKEENSLKIANWLIDWNDFSATSASSAAVIPEPNNTNPEITAYNSSPSAAFDLTTNQPSTPSISLLQSKPTLTPESQLNLEAESVNVIFYPQGTEGAIIIDPTVSLSTSTSTVQIDVANKYRAIMETGSSTDFVTVYDRAENDSAPDEVFVLRGIVAYEEGTYYNLRLDAKRKTTIVESNSARIRIRVEGCLYSSSCLGDASGDDHLIIDEYTFTTEGVFVSLITDFRDEGLSLDTTTTTDYLQPFRVTSNSGSVTTVYSETVLYGNGATESCREPTGDPGSCNEGSGVLNGQTDNDGYIVLQGSGSYQDVIFGAMNLNDNKTLSNSTNAQDYYDIDASGEEDTIEISDRPTQTIINKGTAQFFIGLASQTDLDTEAERESVYNDLTNPDVLTYTTGSEWDDTSGGSSLSAPSAASPGLKFDGTSDYVDAGSNSSLDLVSGGAFTIEGWFQKNTASTATWERIVFRNVNGTQNAYQLVAGSSPGTLTFIFDVYSGGTEYVRNTSDFNLNQWYHIAAIYNSGTITLYVNGANDTQAGGGSGAIGNVSNLLIGKRSDNVAATYYGGKIDELRIWNDVRTASEIQQNMYKQIDSTSGNLVGYWRFNENTGTTAHDETTNNNDGTISGALWQTGYVPDHYNEAEGAYTVDASGDQVNLDIDGGNSASTLASGAVTAASTTVTVDDASAFLASGTAYIEGDRFTYTSITDGATDTFNGVPSSGEDSVIGHADNSVVSQMNRHKPMWKIRSYRQNFKPTAITMEYTSLIEGTDYNLDYKPISDADFADELLWASTLESATAITSPDIGSAGTATGLSYVSGRYGGGIEMLDDNDRVNIPVTGADADNFNKAIGALEFWMKPTWNHTDGVAHYFVNNWVDSSNMFDFRKSSGNDLYFRIEANATITLCQVDSASYNIYANEWAHFRLEWDDSASIANQQKIFINGISQTCLTETDDYNSANLTLATYLQIGCNCTAEADAIVDEFRLYGGASTEPDTLAVGGNTADTSEYLFDEADDYTLDFVADDANNRGEYLFIGSDSMFSGLNVDLQTNGVAGTTPDLNWQYWDGTSWADLEAISGFTDGTTNLTADGAIYWSVNPTNWRPYSVNGSTDQYFIRAHLESGSYSTNPIENTIKTDILSFHLLSNLINSSDQTITLALPALVDLMRHGKWFNYLWSTTDGVERPFTF